MFRIKICGVTNPSDAQAAVQAGADAVGLNFYPPSPRSVDLARAREVISALPPSVCKVGVFVNASPEELLRIRNELGLDLLQLHGDEPAEWIARLEGRPVLKAFRCGESGLDHVLEYLERCAGLGGSLAGLLIDALQPGSYGGTGRALDWSVLAAARPRLGALPVALAGGLSPENVAEAIAACRPDAVDTASGVEFQPGKKDPHLVRQFVAAAKKAFAELAGGVGAASPGSRSPRST